MTSEAPITSTATSCVHHWIIEAPSGRESHGVCKRCGEARDFANSTEHVMWEQTNSLRPSVRVSRPREIRLSDEYVED